MLLPLTSAAPPVRVHAADFFNPRSKKKKKKKKFCQSRTSNPRENSFLPASFRPSGPASPGELPGMWQLLLHSLARCDPRAPRSPAAGVDAAAGGALPARDRHRQNTLFRLRRIQTDRASAPTRGGRADRLGIQDRRLRTCWQRYWTRLISATASSSCATRCATRLTKGTTC